jgi:hypothetical protein
MGLYKDRIQRREDPLPMKSVIEILGGAQILFGISFDIQDSFEEYLSEQHRAFLAMLRVIEEDLPRFDVVVGGKPRKRGRPRKGAKKAEKRVKCLARQKSMRPAKALRELRPRVRVGVQTQQSGQRAVLEGIQTAP